MQQEIITDITDDLSDPRFCPYWVLATDYDSYAPVYSCTNVDEQFYVEFAWIVSRSRSLPADTITELKDKLHSDDIETDNMTVTDQTGCGCMPTWTRRLLLFHFSDEWGMSVSNIRHDPAGCSPEETHE